MDRSDAELQKRLAQEASANFKKSTELSNRAAQLFQEAEWDFKAGKKAEGSRKFAEANRLMNEANELMVTGQGLLAEAQQLGAAANESKPLETDGSQSEQLPTRYEEQIDLYRFGIDTIIGNTIQFAAPFQMLSKRLLDETVYNGNLEKYSADSCKADVDVFLSKFSIFAGGFVRIVSERFAETIRKNTLLPEIRGKTTVSLAKQIREESFGDIDAALNHYALISAKLGIRLANTSTATTAVSGALVGGGLDFFLTNGGDSLLGTVAGALIEGSAAQSNKNNLRFAMYRSINDSVRTITTLISATPAKLMDQYVCYMFGTHADFEKRDKEIAYGNQVTSEITGACMKIFALITDVRQKLDQQRQLKKGGQDEELIGVYILGTITSSSFRKVAPPE